MLNSDPGNSSKGILVVADTMDWKTCYTVCIAAYISPKDTDTWDFAYRDAQDQPSYSTGRTQPCHNHLYKPNWWQGVYLLGVYLYMEIAPDSSLLVSAWCFPN